MAIMDGAREARRDRGLIAIVSLLCAAGLLYGGASFHYRATGKGTDYNVFYLAARVAVEQPLELYHMQTSRSSSYTFIYPPVFAVLMRPLWALPLSASVVVWFGLNVGLTLHAAWLLARALAPPGERRRVLAWTLLLGIPYAVENILLGQVHAVMLYLMVRAFLLVRAERPLGGAAWMAVATAIKLVPAIFGLYFVLRRQWRALLVFVLSLAFLSAVVPAIVFGPATTGTLLREFYELQISPFVSLESSSHRIYHRTALRKTPHDQDIRALLMRHFTDVARPGSYPALVLARWDPSQVRYGMQTVLLAILALSVAVTWRPCRERAAPPGRVDTVFSVYVLLSLIVSPRNRCAYWTVLMIPWSVLLARLLDAGASAGVRRAAAVTVAVSALLLSPCLFPLAAWQKLSLGFWGLLALWAGLLVVHAREGGAPAPGPASVAARAE
jgi:glycosyl transferase family 87